MTSLALAALLGFLVSNVACDVGGGIGAVIRLVMAATILITIFADYRREQ